MTMTFKAITGTCNTSSQRILVVDDDPHIVGLLLEYLTGEGYEVASASSSRELFQQLKQFHPDLVILDLMLGQEDALRYARELGQSYNLAVIILSGRSDLSDRLSGLEMGVDDYITKPFDIREVLARVRTVLRRTASCRECLAASPASAIACFAGWQLDPVNHVLMAPEGVEVALTSHEFRALCAFVQHAPQVLSRDQLMDYLYPNKTLAPFDRRIDVLVLKLRAKLREPTGRPRLIKTIRGAGYVLTAQVSYREQLNKPANTLVACPSAQLVRR